MRPSGDSSSSLTPGRLREALETLGAQLARDGTVAHLYVVGGSCLLLRGTTTRATRDVDVVALALGGGDVPDFAGADELPMK